MKHSIITCLTIFATIFSFAQVPSPDAVLQLDPANGYNISFAGTAFTGTAYILYANSAKPTITKPIFICDGFDPGDERGYFPNTSNPDDPRGLYQLANSDSKDGSSTQNLIGQLRSLCFDIILVNWHQGAGFIQGNALLYIEFIKYINSIKTTNEKLVFIGPSMGGLITRYALAKMEKDGVEHQARLFISFDTPHSGAVISLGIQHLIEALASLLPPFNEEAVSALQKLNSDAAKQMLVNHWIFTNFPSPNAPKPHPYRQQLLDDFDALGNGGYPQKVRKIAISNGNGNPGDTPLLPGDQLVDFEATVQVRLFLVRHLHLVIQPKLFMKEPLWVLPLRF